MHLQLRHEAGYPRDVALLRPPECGIIMGWRSRQYFSLRVSGASFDNAGVCTIQPWCVDCITMRESVEYDFDNIVLKTVGLSKYIKHIYIWSL